MRETFLLHATEIWPLLCVSRLRPSKQLTSTHVWSVSAQRGSIMHKVVTIAYSKRNADTRYKVVTIAYSKRKVLRQAYNNLIPTLLLLKAQFLWVYLL